MADSVNGDPHRGKKSFLGIAEVHSLRETPSMELNPLTPEEKRVIVDQGHGGSLSGEYDQFWSKAYSSAAGVQYSVIPV